jgi:two-component system, OmpR family, response regulator
MQARRAKPTDKLVVVIDDDRTILQAMDGLLQSWGYRVVTAVSDAEALHQLAGRRPDLIICDHRLTKGTFGHQAIERLREAFEIPAMLITGDSAPLEPQESGAGRHRTLFKPLNPNLLKEALEAAFKDKPRG